MYTRNSYHCRDEKTWITSAQLNPLSLGDEVEGLQSPPTSVPPFLSIGESRDTHIDTRLIVPIHSESQSRGSKDTEPQPSECDVGMSAFALLAENKVSNDDTTDAESVLLEREKSQGTVVPCI